MSMALFTPFQERHGSGLAYLNPKFNSKISPGFLRILCRPEAHGHETCHKKGTSLRKELWYRDGKKEDPQQDQRLGLP